MRKIGSLTGHLTQKVFAVFLISLKKQPCGNTSTQLIPCDLVVSINTKQLIDNTVKIRTNYSYNSQEIPINTCQTAVLSSAVNDDWNYERIVRKLTAHVG